MTPEDIDKLADEYADKECAMSRHTGKKLKQLHEDKIIEFYDVFGFLIERFCIIPKSKVKEECDFWRKRLPKNCNLASEVNNNPDTARMWGKIEVLDDIFGKDTFEEEGE